MGAPFLRGSSSSPSESWLTRVRDNLRQLLMSPKLIPSASNGAPIHLLKLDPMGKAGRAQTASLLTHGAIVASILLLAMQTRTSNPLPKPAMDVVQGRLLFSAPLDIAALHPSPGHAAGGGENYAIPATHGFLAPRSSVQLAAPRLPDNATHLLPVSPTILDAQAPPTAPAITELGLPWMPKDNDSTGPGKDGGFGTGKKGGMGDTEGPDAGEGEANGPYARGISMPVCNVCPYPVYTDEARHVKMQGTVTLRVLVGTDGRASEIRVARGVGYGLEERAVETVRGWKFTPAHDAARHPVAVWVTIEAVFRLF
jgi:periplasmic protein TonB